MAPGLDGASLARTSEEQYCVSARQMRHNQFWWYYNGLVHSIKRWKPFRDHTGRWWYYVKPGFAWPVNYFESVSEASHGLERKPLLGWQFPVPEENADSRVWLNVMHELKGYGLNRVASNKRRAVRKGIRNLKIEIVDPADCNLAAEACVVWNSHVERTGWNRQMKPERFIATWRELSRWPGTTVIAARDPARGDQLCAWLIARVIDDTVYVDTIASHTDRLEHRPNDTIIFQCLMLAEQMGVRHAHYSLKSKLESLEAFKQSLGFIAHPFTTRLKLRWPIGPILKRARPDIYMRLHGDPVWMEGESVHRHLSIPIMRGRTSASAVPVAAPKLRRPDAENWPQPEVRDISRNWYLPAAPQTKSGWLVYSMDFVLATLQGTITEPQNVRRTPFWITVGSIVQAVMAVIQAILMVLARIPVISWNYEILARTFTRNGAGFFLRSCYWKSRLKYLGQDTLIDQGVEIWGAANISIGCNCHIDTHVRLAAGERRHGQKGSITIGDYVHLGPSVHIAGRGTVVIQDCVGISALTHIYSATNTIELPSDPGQLISMSHMAPPNEQHIYEAPVIIEPYAFVGMMSRIMPGTRIGFGAVVHAATELSGDVPPFANYAGLPRGKQIGWRRPRRISPNLPRSADQDSRQTPPQAAVDKPTDAPEPKPMPPEQRHDLPSAPASNQEA